jgi:hypothetical protein
MMLRRNYSFHTANAFRKKGSDGDLIEQERHERDGVSIPAKNRQQK